MLTGPYEFDMPWIIVSIALYVTLAVVGLALYSPTLARQIRVYETDGPESPEFASLGARARILGAVLAAHVGIIIVLMVVKPGA